MLLTVPTIWSLAKMGKVERGSKTCLYERWVFSPKPYRYVEASQVLIWMNWSSKIKGPIERNLSRNGEVTMSSVLNCATWTILFDQSLVTLPALRPSHRHPLRSPRFMIYLSPYVSMSRLIRRSSGCTSESVPFCHEIQTKHMKSMIYNL